MCGCFVFSIFHDHDASGNSDNECDDDRDNAVKNHGNDDGDRREDERDDECNATGQPAREGAGNRQNIKKRAEWFEEHGQTNPHHQKADEAQNPGKHRVFAMEIGDGRVFGADECTIQRFAFFNVRLNGCALQHAKNDHWLIGFQAFIADTDIADLRCAERAGR